MSLFSRIKRIVTSEIESLKDSSRHSSLSEDRSSKGLFNEKSSPSPSLFTAKELEYYANLEVPAGAHFDEIKRSYKELLKKYHPDKFHRDQRTEFAQTITQKLNEAYEYFENKDKESKK